MDNLLARCDFPAPGSAVDLAVSGGSDSVGLFFLAHDAKLDITVHHVNHHLRDSADEDARFVSDLATRFGYRFVIHDVAVDASRNLEANARAARYAVLPPDCLTGHTGDDVAETVMLRLMRGTGVDGVAPLVGRRDRPLLALRRHEIREWLVARGEGWRDDESNEDRRLTRNAVRLDLLPLMSHIAQRDVVPLLMRFALNAAESRRESAMAINTDSRFSLEGVSCHTLMSWPLVRLHRWLRHHLTVGGYPPSRAEIDRVVAVINGEATACELSGGRRVARRRQHLVLSDSTRTSLAP
jgi:tRNA(Ile)-lysidine synthase